MVANSGRAGIELRADRAAPMRHVRPIEATAPSATEAAALNVKAAGFRGRDVLEFGRPATRILISKRFSNNDIRRQRPAGDPKKRRKPIRI